jgi:hypothetical protein
MIHRELGEAYYIYRIEIGSAPMNSTQDKKELITKQQQQTQHNAKPHKPQKCTLAKIMPLAHYRIRSYLFSEVLSAFRLGIQSLSRFV